MQNTLLWFTDKEKVMQQLQPPEGESLTLVAAADGRVVQRVSGFHSEEKAQRLAAALAELYSAKRAPPGATTTGDEEDGSRAAAAPQPQPSA